MNVQEGIARWLTVDERGDYIGAVVSNDWRKGRACLAKHILHSVGEAELATFGAQEVWSIQKHCQRLGLKPSTINHITHSVLRGMLRDLESAGLVDAAIFDRVRKAKQLRLSRDPRVKAFTVEQRDRAIEAFRGHWAFPIVAFLFLTGCRVSEAAGLQWGDIAADGRRAAICRGRVRRQITDCKTEHSQRVIDIPDDLVAILAALPRPTSPTDWVFRGRHGKLPVDVHTLRAAAWRPTLKAAGLPPLPIHGARHTWATCALSAGVPLAQVAAHLGDTMKVVERTYAHVLPRFDVNVAIGRPTSPPPVAQVVAERPQLRVVGGRDWRRESNS